MTPLFLTKIYRAMNKSELGLCLYGGCWDDSDDGSNYCGKHAEHQSRLLNAVDLMKDATDETKRDVKRAVQKFLNKWPKGDMFSPTIVNRGAKIIVDLDDGYNTTDLGTHSMLEMTQNLITSLWENRGELWTSCGLTKAKTELVRVAR